jgi:hypothetical protein
MLKKASISKGASIVLVISMVGIGVPSMTSALTTDENSAPAVSQTAQVTSPNTLSSLELQGTQGIIPFDQGAFSAGTYTYSATVTNDVKSVTLLGSSANTNATVTITVNGQTVDNKTDLIPVSSQPGVYQLVIPLQLGANQIAIKVDDGNNQANTYNLTITRMNLLKDIQLSNGAQLSPAFDATVTTYSAQVENNANEITVTPVTSEDGETITVNGNTIADGNGAIVQLSGDTTDIPIVVTDKNDDSVTYTVEVTKAAASTTGGSGSTLSGTGSSSNGTGSSSNNTGSASNSSGSSSNHVGSAGYGPGSSSGSTGSLPVRTSSFSSGTGSSSRGSSSSYSGSGSFGNGSGNYSLMSASQQGTAAVQPSKATLSALTVTAGTWNTAFATDTYTYHIAVGSDVDSVAIDGTPTYSGSTVTVNGSVDNAVSLGNQQKTIVPVVVTNGTDRKTYVLVFDKTVPQAAATTTDPTASSTANQVADTSIQNFNGMSGSNNWGGGNWNGGNNNGTANTSFWSRLINSIRSFFSSL